MPAGGILGVACATPTGSIRDTTMSGKLLLAIVVAMVAAIATVLIFGGAAANVYWIGQFFLRSLQTLVVPLVMLSWSNGLRRWRRPC
ncbi:MAG: hypothetical protein R3C68_18250 [Myxococcota bacterium]